MHESDWRTFIDALVVFRKKMKSMYGLPLRGEVHASEFINKRTFDLEKHIRLAILRNSIDELAKLQFISVTNVIVDKQGKPPNYDVFHNAWGTLFQRFENTLQHGNFPGGFKNDYGMVLTDATAGQNLTRLVRKMAIFNYIPHNARHGQGSRNMPIKKIIEDPHGKDSKDSLPIQMCDVTAYFLLQRSAPNSYVKKRKANLYFNRLEPVLNKKASNYDGLGIVRL